MCSSLFNYLLVLWAKLDSLLNTKSIVDDAPLLLRKIPYIESVVSKKSNQGMHNILFIYFKIMFFFIYNPGCPGQLTRTTTNPRIHWTPCKSSKQVRHCGGDRRAHRESNLGVEVRNSLPRPLGHDLKCSN
jgi:hypothetical protein